MAIVSSDILMKYTVKTGSAGNTVAGTAAGSLGTYVSTTSWGGGTKNDILDDVSGGENAASTADYRCIMIHNNHATLTWQAVVVYLSSEVAGGASLALAADTTATSALGASSAQALTATTETAPGGTITGLTFTSPTTAATGIVLGDIPAGNVKAYWIKRTPANTAAVTGDGGVITSAGDTAA